MSRRFTVCLVVGLLVCALGVSAATAAENDSFGQKAKNFWKKLWGYPARLTEESATVVSDTTKNTAQVVSTSAKDTTAVVSGELGKTKDMIANPITGTAETVGETAKGIIEAPIKAAEEEPAQQ